MMRGDELTEDSEELLHRVFRLFDLVRPKAYLRAKFSLLERLPCSASSVLVSRLNRLAGIL